MVSLLVELFSIWPWQAPHGPLFGLREEDKMTDRGQRGRVAVSAATPCEDLDKGREQDIRAWIEDVIRMARAETDPNGGPRLTMEELTDYAMTSTALDRLRTPTTEPSEPVGWRPIETAPKDQGCILAYRPAGKFFNGVEYPEAVGLVYWRDADGLNPDMWCGGGGGMHPREHPTHWMPLPAPPDAHPVPEDPESAEVERLREIKREWETLVQESANFDPNDEVEAKAEAALYFYRLACDALNRETDG